MTDEKAHANYKKAFDALSEDEREKLLRGSWDTTIEYQAIQNLRSRLHPHQLDAFDHIHWLFHGGRATGRSYLIATVAVCEALYNPGRNIYIADHVRKSYRSDWFLELTYSIIEVLPKEIVDCFKINRQQMWIRYDHELNL